MPIAIREVFGITEFMQANLDLGREHYDEIARNKQIMVFNPDIERFQDIENSGLLLSIAAFDGDKMVGYSVTILSNHLHYANLNCAYNDMLYVHPDYRKGRVGLQLIRETQQRAKARGAQFMTWHAKESTPLAALLPKLGCKVQDIIFSEEL
jgi:predicted GNAT superfamily acetyltransferase